MKFKWTDVKQKAFDNIKQTMAYNTWLPHTDFNQQFDIYTDAINLQLGEVIRQGKTPLHFIVGN